MSWTRRDRWRKLFRTTPWYSNRPIYWLHDWTAQSPDKVWPGKCVGSRSVACADYTAPRTLCQSQLWCRCPSSNDIVAQACVWADKGISVVALRTSRAARLLGITRWRSGEWNWPWPDFAWPPFRLGSKCLRCKITTGESCSRRNTCGNDIDQNVVPTKH